MNDQYLKEKLEEHSSQLVGLHDKLDKVILTQTVQAEDIKHHIARTDALEAIVLPLHEKKLERRGIINLFKYTGYILGVAISA